ncbi:MAG: glycosyltransferase [Nodosilinea sp.]
MRSLCLTQTSVAVLGSAQASPPIAKSPAGCDRASAYAPGGRRARIVLYSHDTMGLGHKRRNLLIAQALGAADLDVDILLISGMGEASVVPTPTGVDTLTLPALYKRPDGQYQARRLSLSLEEVVTLRSQLILAAIQNFQPDLLIVDNVPRGAVRELDATLEYIRHHLPTHCVLGLRDVLDAPAAVRRDWQRAETLTALRRYYDTIWVYGDSSIYDCRREYRFPADVAAKVRPLGYLDPRTRQASAAAQAEVKQLGLPAHRRLVLCQVGGGQDGFTLAAAFARAAFPADVVGVLLTGPFMPAEAQQQLRALAQDNPRLRLVDYLIEPTLLLAQASQVVAMGGYNTTCEILAYQKPALVVPRLSPRQEQWIRAKRLHRHGLIDLLHPAELSPEALTAWLQRPVPPRPAQSDLNLGGLKNLVVEVQRLMLLTHLPESQAS